MNQKMKTIAIVKLFGITVATADEIISIANRYQAMGGVIIDTDLSVAELLRQELKNATTLNVSCEEWLDAFIKLTK